MAKPLSPDLRIRIIRVVQDEAISVEALPRALAWQHRQRSNWWASDGALSFSVSPAKQAAAALFVLHQSVHQSAATRRVPR